MITKSAAVLRFLNAYARPDLARLYSLNMECQVNVAQDNGERIEGDFEGHKWRGWTDGITTWKSFRIPYHADSEPEYNDSEIKFDLELHVEAIGMTGWDWKNRCSRWVAFDFDAIVGHSDKHSKKLTNDELEHIRNVTREIDWVTIRKSTSGTGLHLYVYLEDVETQNHHEHAALARAILGKLSALVGHDFNSQVDICGGNMWVWHRKMVNTDGLTLLKKGTVLTDIPANWQDHIKVVNGRRRKNLPQFIDESISDIFEELCGQRTKIPLDEDHKKLITFLRDSNALWWWDQDHHMLVTHTAWLKKAHEDLGLKGIFETNSDATNLHEQNCFCFPMRNGAWGIRRYTIGVTEHQSWEQDGAGWTRCYFNRRPDLRTAALAMGALEDTHGGFLFREAEVAAQTANLLGADVKYDKAFASRETRLKEHKDGRLVVSVERKEQDRADEMRGWVPERKTWTRIYNVHVNDPTESDTKNYDDIVRHLITESGEDSGWMIKSDDIWRSEPLTHVRIALQSLGAKPTDINNILGSSVLRCWKIVNKPFQPEYPGDREWNRNSAQLRFLPSPSRENLHFDTWRKVLSHCGVNLTATLKENPWAKVNGVLNGEEYLLYWIASLFQFPSEPLPYLFLYGEQNTGKSILHEALSLLLTSGYKRADIAITSQGGYNAELEGMVLCIIEETDLKRNHTAYNRIKDWVTSRDVLIHAKYSTPYHVPNTTHWIQCSNDHSSCPIFPGDTRITMMYVPPLPVEQLIPKRQLITLLEKEASDFLAHLMGLEIPESSDRLRIPVIETEEKMLVQHINKTALQLFLEEKCTQCNGYWIKFSDFFERFQKSLDSEEFHNWSKIRVGRELPVHYPKGRNASDGQFYIGNMVWKGTETEKRDKYILKDTYLVQEQPCL